MCKTEHHFGLAVYRAKPGCQHGNSDGEIHGHLLEDERGSVSSLFAKVFRTDDTDHIPYSCLYLPCSFAHLLALLYFPFLLNVFLLPPAAYLHHIHQQGEREALLLKA